jgi:hypothetical protein
LSLKNIGNADGNQNGAAIKDVVMQVVTALTAKAADASNLPPEVKLLLGQDLNGLSKQLGPGFDGQFQDVAGSLTKHLSPKLRPMTGSRRDQLHPMEFPQFRHL